MNQPYVEEINSVICRNIEESNLFIEKTRNLNYVFEKRREVNWLYVEKSGNKN